jgi:phytoene dehydrogenase-like protein
MKQTFDHIVIGAGHNGLACAHALARAGRSVLLLEAAAQAGGAAVTREFAPGCRVSAAAHLLGGLSGALIRDMELERHGLALCARDLPTVALHPAQAPIVIRGASVSGAGDADARAYPAFRRRMARFAGIIEQLAVMRPFRLSFETRPERLDALRLALGIRLLGRRDMREFLRIAAMNAYDLLCENFTSERLRGALAMDATLGAEYAARSPGTVLTLLHRWAGPPEGPALPAGGMGAVTQAMARSAAAAGARLRTGARVRSVTVEQDRASGVVLESGEILAAKSVVSNADPRTTFLRLVPPEALDTDFVRRVSHLRARGLVAKLHLAVDGLPAFQGLDAQALGGRLLIAPSLDYLELAYNPSKYREVPAEPAMEITVPSLHDASLAPAGTHVMSINLMFVPYEAAAGAQGARDRLLEAALRVLERHAPGLEARIRASELLMPADLEREFGMAGGHWHHGALALDQYFFSRPVFGAARYGTPLPGLYLCGAGSHPGGGVHGLAGRNAARAILEGTS